MSATVERIDKYTIRVNGTRVRADAVQEAQIRVMDDEQVARFVTIMGGQ